MFPIITEVVVDPYQAVSALKSQKAAKALGSGCCATVYETAKGSVLRVGGLQGNQGYLSFVRELSKVSHNPHTPKIFAVHVFVAQGTDEGVLAVEMEKLQHWHDSSEFHKYINLYQKVEMSLANLGAPRKASKELREALHIIKKAARRSGHSTDMAPFNTMLRDDGTLVITDPIWM